MSGFKVGRTVAIDHPEANITTLVRMNTRGRRRKRLRRAVRCANKGDSWGAMWHLLDRRTYFAVFGQRAPC